MHSLKPRIQGNRAFLRVRTATGCGMALSGSRFSEVALHRVERHHRLGARFVGRLVKHPADEDFGERGGEAALPFRRRAGKTLAYHGHELAGFVSCPGSTAPDRLAKTCHRTVFRLHRLSTCKDPGRSLRISAQAGSFSRWRHGAITVSLHCGAVPPAWDPGRKLAALQRGFVPDTIEDGLSLPNRQSVPRGHRSGTSRPVFSCRSGWEMLQKNRARAEREARHQILAGGDPRPRHG